MKNLLQLRIFAMALFALLASASMAHAQATRTWVSGVGDDANPCSRTAPCKTFAGAISKTAPCGEIDVLDPGGFGAVTITKCISIETDDVSVAGVLVSGTNAIIIAAGASDVVMLRGLTIDGLGTGLAGIKIISAGAVFVEECWINHFTGNGATTGSAIDVEPGAPTTNLNLSLREVKIRDNSTAGTFPIFIKPAAGVTVHALLDNVTIENNAGGLRVAANGSTVALQSTVISTNSSNGIASIGGGVVQISSVSVLDNTGIGLFQTGSQIISFKNNSVLGNGGGDGTPTSSPGTI